MESSLKHNKTRLTKWLNAMTLDLCLPKSHVPSRDNQHIRIAYTNLLANRARYT